MYIQAAKFETPTTIMENKITPTSTLIKKERVSDLHFPNDEVLNTPDSIQERRSQLGKAASLGNLDKHKVNIIFEDDEGIKRVNTTVWAVTETKVVLKAGKAIPINRVHKVNVY